jgi:hypothetical protein
MNRWRRRLDEMQSAGYEDAPYNVQIVQNVQKPSPDPPFGQFEQFEQRTETTASGPPAASEAEEGATAADATWWRDCYEERAAIRQYGGYPRDEAELLAWREVETRWHMARGERVATDLCAGCRCPIGEAEALDLIDGSRVHHRVDNDCLIRHGERWRAAAARALVALGLQPPSR